MENKTDQKLKNKTSKEKQDELNGYSHFWRVLIIHPYTYLFTIILIAIFIYFWNIQKSLEFIARFIVDAIISLTLAKVLTKH